MRHDKHRPGRATTTVPVLLGHPTKSSDTVHVLGKRETRVEVCLPRFRCVGISFLHLHFSARSLSRRPTKRRVSLAPHLADDRSITFGSTIVIVRSPLTLAATRTHVTSSSADAWLPPAAKSSHTRPLTERANKPPALHSRLPFMHRLRVYDDRAAVPRTGR